MKKPKPATLRTALKMFKGFMKQAKGYLKDKEQLHYLITAALSMARSRGGKLWEDVQILVRLLKAWKNGSYDGVPGQTLVAVVAAILYFISPLDVIPDFIPVIGYIDDAAVIAWVLKSISKDIDDFRDWEKSCV